jgi:shikimate kinase
MNIALIGPRGVGKSKVARKLSKEISYPVISTDMISVYEAGGISIPEQVKRKNGKWNEFRKLEYDILEKLKDSQNIILDCGGGILFDVDSNGNEFYSEKKVKLLKSFTKIITLARDTEYLISKVINDSTRPELSQINSYREILERRLPYYKITGDIYLSIDDLEIKDVAKKIVQILDLNNL